MSVPPHVCGQRELPQSATWPMGQAEDQLMASAVWVSMLLLTLVALFLTRCLQDYCAKADGGLRLCHRMWCECLSQLEFTPVRYDEKELSPEMRTCVVYSRRDVCGHALVLVFGMYADMHLCLLCSKRTSG